MILGHEIVARGASRTSALNGGTGLGRGLRRPMCVVEATFGCGRCERCRMGRYRMCNVSRGYGGAVRSDQAPYLWGGYGQFVYLPPTARVHRISEELPGDVAVLVCAVLGNGVRWLRTVGGVTIGDTAVVVGPGPQGLAATVAARESSRREAYRRGRPVARRAAPVDGPAAGGNSRHSGGPGRPQGRGSRADGRGDGQRGHRRDEHGGLPTTGAGPGGNGRHTGAGGRRGPASEPANDGQDHGGRRSRSGASTRTTARL